MQVSHSSSDHIVGVQSQDTDISLLLRKLDTSNKQGIDSKDHQSDHASAL